MGLNLLFFSTVPFSLLLGVRMTESLHVHHPVPAQTATADALALHADPIDMSNEHRDTIPASPGSESVRAHIVYPTGIAHVEPSNAGTMDDVAFGPTDPNRLPGAESFFMMACEPPQQQ